jgi:hypothetical protein
MKFNCLIKWIFYLLLFVSSNKIRANSAFGFMENKGQILDQNKIPNSDVKFIFNGANFNLHLRLGGFSYESYTIKSKEKELYF